MTDDPIRLVWEQRWVARPLGTHFSEHTGSMLAFADGTNLLQAQAKLGGVIDPLPGRIKVAAALLVGTAGGIAGTKTWSRVRSRRSNRAIELEAPLPSVEAFCSEAHDAVAVYEWMSGAEAERRIQEVLLAAAIIAKHLRALAAAGTPRGASSELQEAMRALSAPRLTDSLNRMLASDGPSLDEERSAAFLELLGGGRTAEGELIELRHNAVAQALRLPQAAAA